MSETGRHLIVAAEISVKTIRADREPFTHGSNADIIEPPAAQHYSIGT